MAPSPSRRLFSALWPPVLALLGSACGSVALCGPVAERLAEGEACCAAAQCQSNVCHDGYCTASWPAGVDGDLRIAAGETVQLPSGAVLDYRSLTVEAGGVLELLPGADWTLIGCRGELRLDGRLVARQGTSCGGVSEARAPDAGGEALRFVLTQALGGHGGAGGGGGLVVHSAGDSSTISARSPGGAPDCGNGGGGGGGGGSGGSGARGLDGPVRHQVGSGSDGLAGAPGADGLVGTNQGGLGGRGGMGGLHGQALYLRAGRIAGDGTIDVRGGDGGAGGQGGGGRYTSAPESGSGGGGGGGGGGAGGSGGAVVLRTTEAVAPGFLGRVLVGGGAGGAGGAGGSRNGGIGEDGLAGEAGQPGADGWIDARTE